MTVAREFGKHYLIELINCTRERLERVEEVQRIMLLAAARSNTTVLSHDFHQFAPHGVSGILFIAESHFAIHTWPEDGYAAADIFTCGPRMNPDVAVSVMAAEFGAGAHRVRIISRGLPPP